MSSALNSQHSISGTCQRTLRRAFQQEEHIEKERVMLDALRMRDEDRVKRFMNAKNRSIGIDKISLDKQVEEKRLLELAQWEEKLVEGEELDD